MKSLAALLVAASALAAAPNPPQVAQVRTVYLLPMTNGLDQYLANRLTNLGVVQVVTDPAKADAVLTDSLGAAFENRLDALFPAPPPPAPEKDKADKKDAGKSTADSTMKGDTATRVSSLHRGKGTVFLVDSHSRVVLWSVYDRPKNTKSAELDRTAERIAGRIKRAMKGK
ncbi:MAG: hypothetical protein ACM336_22110 [Acidobacteriota bacterium]